MKTQQEGDYAIFLSVIILSQIAPQLQFSHGVFLAEKQNGCGLILRRVTATLVDRGTESFVVKDANGYAPGTVSAARG